MHGLSLCAESIWFKDMLFKLDRVMTKINSGEKSVQHKVYK